MKKVIILSFVLVNTFFAAFSQSDKFNAAMSSTLDQMKAAKTPEEVTAVAAKFERIGDAEKTQWLPYYYAALIKARAAFEAKDKDKVADEASATLDKAEALEKNNSEIFCVKATIAYAHMMVDPMTRYMQYGADATNSLKAAKKADPSNPRPVLMEANSLYRMPEQFGGGCNTAKPVAEKAAKLFADFKPASTLHPNWGKDNVDEILNSCK
jgi:hypothetical protein